MTEEICNVVYRGISRYIDTASEKVLFCFFTACFLPQSIVRSERRESCNPEHLLERQEQNLEIRCHGAFSDQCCGVCLKIQCRMDTLHPTIFARHCTSSARPAEGEGQTYDVEKTIALVRTFLQVYGRLRFFVSARTKYTYF